MINFSEIEDKDKKIVIILMVSISFIVILFGYLMYYIWKPSSSDDNITTEQQEINYYEFTSYTTEDVITEYFNEISTYFLSEDKENIYNFTSEDFLNEKNFDADELYDYLDKKGILNTLITCTEYKVIEHYDLGYVYELNLLTNNNVNEKILIIEESPNNYKISFDNYIYETYPDVSMTINGLKFTVDKIKEYTTKLYITMSFENTTQDNIVINNKYNYEAIYLSFSDSNTILHSNSWLSGSPRTIKPNEIIKYEFIYDISELSGGSITSITVLDVLNDSTKEETSIEYEIFK